jgi:ribosomal protein L37E
MRERVNTEVSGFMAYTAYLQGHGQITIAFKDPHTSITLVISNPGQQQSQSTSFTTGNWTAPPKLLPTASSYVLQITSETGNHFISIEATGIRTLANAPLLDRSNPIKLEPIFEPKTNYNNNTVEFKPMQMGNMSMSMTPMSMRLGNMSMTMGEGFKSASSKIFCTQCGREAKIDDLFCSSCGHQLNH